MQNDESQPKGLAAVGSTAGLDRREVISAQQPESQLSMRRLICRLLSKLGMKLLLLGSADRGNAVAPSQIHQQTWPLNFAATLRSNPRVPDRSLTTSRVLDTPQTIDLTLDDLGEIEQRSEIYRNWLLPKTITPKDAIEDLSVQAYLALIDVPRLVAWCRMVMAERSNS